MRKKGAIPLIVAVILLAGFLFVAGTGLMPEGGLLSLIPADLTGNCQNVYCTDYEFICCGLKNVGHSSFTSDCTLWNCENYYTCTAQKCVITQINPNSGLKITRSDGETYYSSLQTPYTILKGEKIRSVSTQIKFEIDLYEQNLAWCGDAACDAGVTGITVWGADGCTYVTDKNLYSSSGILLKSPSSGQISYTVPLGECYLSSKGRTVCGDTCESCKANSDCIAGHQLQYNGYGAECNTGLLEWYGCRNYGEKPSDFDLLPGESAGYNYGSRCEVIGSKRVQCCPSTSSCGSNAVCDPETFTCKQSQEVGCTADWQCGTAEFYDQPSKQIRKPACTLGQCSYAVIQNVECYYNTECPSGWYCDTDFKCKQSSSPKTSCPNVCCVGDSRYFDRPCPPDKATCCPDGQSCQATMQDCIDEGHGKPAGINWLMIILGSLIMIIVIVALVFILSGIIPVLMPLRMMMLNPIVWIVLFLIFIVLFAGIAISTAELAADMVGI